MLEASLREQWGAPELQVIGLDGQRGSDDLREQPWLPVKYGSVDPDEWHGLVRARARFRRRPGAPAETLPLVAKVAPRRGLAQTLIPWIIERESVRLPRRYGEFDAARESTGTAPREYETYRLARSVAALGRTLPGCYGGGPSADGEYVVFLEEIHHPLLTDPGGEIAGWAGEQIDVALEAVGGIHAAFLGRGEQIGR